MTLHGEDSYDSDSDPITYDWQQLSGSPLVSLGGADSANPTFAAPYIGAGGASGVIATLGFELTVDDGYGETSTDSVVDEITHANNDPVAAAGEDQTVNENTEVALNAGANSDPDGDLLGYEWTQVDGPPVMLDFDTSAEPTFIAPFVGAGGADLTFEVTVDDGYGGKASDTVVVHVQNSNDPPLASAARPTVATLWPPNHQMVSVGITGVTDADDSATITVTGVTQDEPTNGLGDGDTAIDAPVNPDGTVLLRAERPGNGNGRVYRIAFTASELEGEDSGVVFVTVPRNAKKPAIDSGDSYDSTQ